MEEQINQLKTQLEQIKSLKELEILKLKYLGKSGILKEFSQNIKDVSNEEKPAFGQKMNEFKNTVTQLLFEKEQELCSGAVAKEFVDYSIHKETIKIGSLHPATHAIFEIEDILGKIGFVKRRYRESESDWYAFEALNMPQDHPARDEWETFYLSDGNLLTPHTSNGQIREMENRQPPIKMLNIAKTYRRQSDMGHSPMFHQFEGLYVDKNVSIAHLKGTLDYFIKMFFGPDRLTRIRPYDFLFTEPSFEVDVSCNKCEGKGCKLCKRGWHEIGGAGMVHPNVLKAVNIDPDVYNGFAFGFGVERPYMMKGNINIPDIRMFYETDLSFLRKF